MSYQKPQLIAKSEPKQSYVGGCPPQNRGGGVSDPNDKYSCINCERTQ